MMCKNCGNEIDSSMKFCPHCGAKQEEKRFCPNCGEECGNQYAFCPVCGTKLGEQSARSESGEAPHTAYAIYAVDDAERSTTANRQSAVNSQPTENRTPPVGTPAAPLATYKRVPVSLNDSFITDGTGTVTVYSDRLAVNYWFKTNALLSLPLGLVRAAKDGGTEIQYSSITSVTVHGITFTTGNRVGVHLADGTTIYFGFMTKATCVEFANLIKQNLPK